MHRDFVLKLKSLDEAGSFTGLGSSYNGVDLQGDSILPGAYTQAIKMQGSGYPLLFAHDQSQPLGVAKIADSAAGLMVSGSLVMADPKAQTAYAHLKAGSLKGLSIGYQVPPGKAEIQRDGSRIISEVKLHEISLVACPADPRAQIMSVKDLSAALANIRIDQVKADDRAALLTAMKKLLGKGAVAVCECDCPECRAGDCSACSDPDCDDPNCSEGDDAETLSALKSLAADLRFS